MNKLPSAPKGPPPYIQIPSPPTITIPDNDAHYQTSFTRSQEKDGLLNRRSSLQSFTSNSSAGKQVAFGKDVSGQKTGTQNLADFFRSTGPDGPPLPAPPTPLSANNTISARRSVFSLGRKLGNGANSVGASSSKSDDGNVGEGKSPPVGSRFGLNRSDGLKGVQKVVTASGKTVNIIPYPHRPTSRPSTAPQLPTNRPPAFGSTRLFPAPTSPLPSLPSTKEDVHPVHPSPRPVLSSYSSESGSMFSVEGQLNASSVALLGSVASRGLVQSRNPPSKTVSADRIPILKPDEVGENDPVDPVRAKRPTVLQIPGPTTPGEHRGTSTQGSPLDHYDSVGRTRKPSIQVLTLSSVGAPSTVEDVREAFIAHQELALQMLGQRIERGKDGEVVLGRRIARRHVGCQTSMPSPDAPALVQKTSARPVGDDRLASVQEKGISVDLECDELEERTSLWGSSSDTDPGDFQTPLSINASWSSDASRPPGVSSSSDKGQAESTSVSVIVSPVSRRIGRPTTAPTGSSAARELEKDEEWEKKLGAWQERCLNEKAKRKKVEGRLKRLESAAEEQRARWDDMAGWALEVIESAEGDRTLLRAENARLARELALTREETSG